MSNLRDEVSILGGSLSRLVNRDEVLALIDKYERDKVGDDELKIAFVEQPEETPEVKAAFDKVDSFRTALLDMWHHGGDKNDFRTLALLDAIDANTAAIRAQTREAKQ